MIILIMLVILVISVTSVNGTDGVLAHIQHLLVYANQPVSVQQRGNANNAMPHNAL